MSLVTFFILENDPVWESEKGSALLCPVGKENLAYQEQEHAKSN